MTLFFPIIEKSMHKVNLAQPCSVNLENAVKTENGVFCGSCNKDIIDFSFLDPEEIKHVLLKGNDSKPCGIFSSNQLENPHGDLRDRILKFYYSLKERKNIRAKILLAFLSIVMVLTSCRTVRKGELKGAYAWSGINEPVLFKKSIKDS